MRLVNEYGNLVVYTNDRREIEQLKNQGYKQKEVAKPKKEELPKKEGATKNAKRKGNTDTERDI